MTVGAWVGVRLSVTEGKGLGDRLKVGDGVGDWAGVTVPWGFSKATSVSVACSPAAMVLCSSGMTLKRKASGMPK